MTDADSVEQRCARIRGRMQWILAQLETADEIGGGSGEKLRLQQEQWERKLRVEHEAEIDRLQRIHSSEVASLRSELAASREQAFLAKSNAHQHEESAMRAVAAERAAIETSFRDETKALHSRVTSCERALGQAMTALVAVEPHIIGVSVSHPNPHPLPVDRHRQARQPACASFATCCYHRRRMRR